MVSAPPLTRSLSGLAAEPAGEVVGIFEAGSDRGIGYCGGRSQRGLRRLQPQAIPERPQSQPGFPLQFSAEVVGVIAEIFGDSPKARGPTDVFAEFIEERSDRRRGGRRLVEQAGDDGENGRIVAQREPALAWDAGQLSVQLIERGRRQRAVGGATPAGCFGLVVEHEAERAALAGDGETVGCRLGNYKKVTGAGSAAATVDRLFTFAGQIENQLDVVVGVRCNLGVAVAVELQLPQDEAQSVNFDLLNQQRLPG